MTPAELLAPIVGPKNCLIEDADIAPYAVDWRGTYRGTPRAVLRPGSVEEVAASVRACASAGLAIVPAGGRTGLCGGAVVQDNGPPAVVMSLERLNRIRDVDAKDFSLVAEAGCIIQNVQEAAAAAGRLFPLSWGAQGSAMVGGALSTNAGGIRTIRWGNARDLVLGLEVVLPDGRVLNDLRRVRKDNSGYALRHLFLGGEGTLGIITAAALRLVPALKRVETAFVAVPSPDAALSLLSRMLESGADVIAFELIRKECMQVVERHGLRTRMPMALESPWYVMVEIAAAHPAVPLKEMLEDTLAEAAEAGDCTDAVLATNEDQRAGFWRIREDYPDCQRRNGPYVGTDTAVPVSSVPRFLARVEKELVAGWPEGELFMIGHAGDGNIHLGMGAPKGMDYKDWVSRAAGLEALVNSIAVEMGGSFSAEHGIGQSKRHAMASLKDPVALDMMRAIKGAIDPESLMNPGKMLPG
ncbi:MAG: FAD-binding oxidoreductase [Acetobacteraceae bacterium]|nr:FAD-binding oxidoreductase [Acetobacteraceae bacterium]